MKLSIIIPVYNEEKTIKKILDKVLSVKLPRLIGGHACEKEIIVVDDGSTDGTRNGIRNYESGIMNKKATKTPGRWPDFVGRSLDSVGRRPKDSFQVEESKQIKVIYHPYNLGKGAAIQTGIKKATGDYILIQDADLEYNPEEIPRLLTPILKTPRRCPELTEGLLRGGGTRNKPIAVYGSRFKNRQAIIPPLYFLGNKFLTFLTNLLYGTKLTDMETGYKLLPASFLKKINLESKRFDIEPEITALLVKSKIPIIEVPISYKGRTHLAGKKLTVKDAFGAIKTLVLERIRL